MLKYNSIKLHLGKYENFLVITGTFMHGFQNNFAHLLSSRRKNAVQNTCLRRLKVKVTLEGQMIKRS